MLIYSRSHITGREEWVRITEPPARPTPTGHEILAAAARERKRNPEPIVPEPVKAADPPIKASGIGRLRRFIQRLTGRG